MKTVFFVSQPRLTTWREASRAVKTDGQAIEYATESLRADREIVLAAVESSGSALECADDNFKKHRGIALVAVELSWSHFVGQVGGLFKVYSNC